MITLYCCRGGGGGGGGGGGKGVGLGLEYGGGIDNLICERSLNGNF